MAAFRHDERRHTVRLYEPFPVLIRGVDAVGQTFECRTVLDDFSADGLFVRLDRYLELGSRLFAVVSLTTNPDPDIAAPRVAARGIVVRAELQIDGRWGVAMRFTRHRFL